MKRIGEEIPHMLDIPVVTLNNGVSMPQFGLGVYLLLNDQTEKSVWVALDKGVRLGPDPDTFASE
ncbi:hypothetical protein KSD_95320 [Ktedonobacter sp. SOSP1-85]|uniref:hypothetical protein n=1 Tax=Ktedonobacter sp. SOSP1-85 TaxID=2778367 RepID=UPI001916A934|nr:hypothetical protein [Ktedonobacter sp. SOSP1-85]GHO81761.1 hypothetical protein KSD_95320 [Ktedonobacter sp. SOSP1-85]